MAGIFSLIQHPNGRLFLMPVIVLSAIGMCGAKASEPEIEVEDQSSSRIETSKLLPPELIKSDSYSLSKSTLVYRGVALYEMESEFGRSTLVGDRGLMERIDELSAIGQLRELIRQQARADEITQEMSLFVRYGAGSPGLHAVGERHAVAIGQVAQILRCRSLLCVKGG